MAEPFGYCPNPKCGKPIWTKQDDHCGSCGHVYSDEFKKQFRITGGMAGGRAAVNREAVLPSSPNANLVKRYVDAYLVGRTIDRVGQVYKSIGVVIGILIVVVGLVASDKVGTAAVVVAIFFAVLVAVGFVVLGILVSAQGQILTATLDTAVNSSPLLSHDEVRQILIP